MHRPSGRPLSKRRPSRGPRHAWVASVRLFAREDLAGSSIGDAWKRRVQYEILRTPTLIRKAGEISAPSTPGRLRAAHIEQLKHGLSWSSATFGVHFNALRRFLRWARNPLAADRGVWAVPQDSTGRRRWLAPEQLFRLYRAAQGRERVLLALEAFNGLRRVEVLRLRGMDVDFARQRLHVLGKGRNGGKWRTLPMFSETARVLRSHRFQEGGHEPLVPLSPSGADLLLRRVAERAGFPSLGVRVSHHDLRRTFGRLAHKAGMDLVQLKNLYGHSSLDQTVHYIGLDEDEMRDGLHKLAIFIEPQLGNKPQPANPR